MVKKSITPANWKINVKKMAKLRGEEHQDYKNRTVPALFTGPDCR